MVEADDNLLELELDIFRYAPRSVLVVLFAVFLAVIIISNVSVLFVLLTSSKMRTSTNTHIASICIASLLVGVFACASSLYELVGTGGIGKSDPATCVTLLYLELLSITACVFAFTAIAVDRYRTIVEDNKPRFTLKTTYIILVVGWISAVIYGSRSVLQLSFPQNDDDDDDDTEAASDDENHRDHNKTSSLFGNLTSHNSNEERQICSFFLEDESGDFLFRVFDVILLFIIPFVVMCVLYCRIAFKLWSSAVPTNNNIRGKRKTVRLLVLIMALFFGCWFPFHVFEVIHDGLESQGFELDKDVAGALRVWSLVLAISNSWLNPVVYCYMNTGLRAELKIMITRTLKCFETGATTPDNRVHPVSSTGNTPASS